MDESKTRTIALTTVGILAVVLYVVAFSANHPAVPPSAPSTSQPSRGGPASAKTDSCTGVPESGAVNAEWEGVLTLQELKRTDDARKAAIALLRRAGKLPQQHAECAKVLELFAPAKDSPWPKKVGKQVKDWWWLGAMVLALAVALAGKFVQRPRHRAAGGYPRVRVTLKDAREGATGQTVGARFTATVHAQVLQINSDQLGSGVINVADAADAVTSSLPLDELPSQAQWFVKLILWWGARNHLSGQFTLASTRPGRVCVVPAIVEPSGNLTETAAGQELRDVIERRATKADAEVADYLELTHAAFAWLLFHVKEVLGQAGGLREEVGTAKWDAYANFLEGAAALRAGDIPGARGHFTQSRKIDDSDEFLERELNEAYAYALEDGRDSWEAALKALDALVPLES